ncbi:hypothetical protein FOMPIDRAFT_1058042 [Fomitopsis schrenkii]|uniref:Uncharacterized protein n=1 Tax=Fomitopsis schrenkii TaxID=2126942 RepID=S8G1P5_FOMSC|nr:hypothetical protein FOMPIDRAFT_1058042 [Fomitopsis schrenkii]
MSTASGNYSATATSLTPSETSTYVRNGTSSASGNGTSTIVVTSTATSVKTVTSVSTDIETMVTTVTGRDTTEIYTTTQTLVSTIVVPTTATGGLLPVNGAAGAAMLPRTVAATVCVATVLWLLCSMDCGAVW